MARDGNLRQMLRQHLGTWHWVTVETGGTGRGVPDAEYCAPGGVAGWVECKFTATATVDLRPEQVAWLLRRARAGGRATVAVRQTRPAGPRRGPAADRLWLLEGSLATSARAGGLVHGAPYVLGVWDLTARDRDRWAQVGAVFTRPMYTE